MTDITVIRSTATLLNWYDTYVASTGKYWVLTVGAYVMADLYPFQRMNLYPVTFQHLFDVLCRASIEPEGRNEVRHVSNVRAAQLL